MKSKIFMIIIFLVSVVWTGCKEEGRIDFIDDSAPAPGTVRNVKVRNTPGGAVLKYTLPVDKNLLYVRAEYEIHPGVMRETKSSYFKDSLVLEGFGDTQRHAVALYSVGKNEKTSDSTCVWINPQTAPVHLATKSMRATFGGVAIDIENPEKANLAIVVMADTAKLGYLSEVITFYTDLPKGTFTYRGADGLAPEELEFSVFFRDRWENYSDTIIAAVTPWFEEFIPKNTWKEYTLPGDHPPVSTNYFLGRIWDENYVNDGFHGNENFQIPSNLTWDLGQTVKLSRLKLWPRKNTDDRWRRGHPRIFEIWGSVLPGAGGDIDDGTWIPLGRFESLKPSGNGTQITQEDVDFAEAGIDFDFVVSDFAPNPYTPVQYIRFRTISTYKNSAFSTVHILELSFWGELIK
ncbi:MAG: DUF4959 domain-containing protein [Bacteroidales bacterium]|jgi:hypothetical protein|nr:DUF4959 domain-containing protein [Bacteroidales bacterium]